MEMDGLTVIGLDHREDRVTCPRTLETPDCCDAECALYSLMFMCTKT